MTLDVSSGCYPAVRHHATCRRTIKAMTNMNVRIVDEAEDFMDKARTREGVDCSVGGLIE